MSNPVILTPPQWVDKQRRAQRQRLWDLVQRWENTDLGASESMMGAIHGEATMKHCAAQLRAILEAT